MTNCEISTNPSCECYHLSRWLPEVLCFDEISDKENLWTRLQQNFTEGNLVLALGTKNSPQIFNAVLDFVTKKNQKLLKLALAPNQKFSPAKNAEKNITYVSNIKGSYSQDSTNIHDIGVYLVDWDTQVPTIFSNIYLSWNPSIYPYRKIINSSWLKGPKETLFWNEAFSLEYNPQFLLRIKPHRDDFEVRMFLERHITEMDPANYSKTVGFKLFSFSSERVLYSHDFLRKLTYSDREIVSDVFIFEASAKTEMYNLTILKSNADGKYWEALEEETFFS